MNEFEMLVHSKKKKALSIAIAVALMTTTAGSMVGCTSKYDDEEDEEDGYVSGSSYGGHQGRSGWWIAGSRGKNSSTGEDSISQSKSSITKNKANITSKSSSYAKGRGGSASS